MAIGAIGPTIGAIEPDLDSAGGCHRGKSAIGAIGDIRVLSETIGVLSEITIGLSDPPSDEEQEEWEEWLDHILDVENLD